MRLEEVSSAPRSASRWMSAEAQRETEVERLVQPVEDPVPAYAVHRPPRSHPISETIAPGMIAGGRVNLVAERTV